MLDLAPVAVTYDIWLVWALSWFAAAVWSSKAQSRPRMGVEMLHRVVTAIGVLLLFFSRSPFDPRRVVLPLPPVATGALWTLPNAVAWACVGLTVAGFAFAWWARVHLGRLWSGSITRKPDHHIVDTGPYGLVRHPIYTGILLGVFALAALKATPAALAGAAVTTLGLWLKARFEEGFLSAELGPEAYAAYRRRVPMLAPFFHV